MVCTTHASRNCLMVNASVAFNYPEIAVYYFFVLLRTSKIIQNYRPMNQKHVLRTENSYSWSPSYSNMKVAKVKNYVARRRGRKLSTRPLAGKPRTHSKADSFTPPDLLSLSLSKLSICSIPYPRNV